MKIERESISTNYEYLVAFCSAADTTTVAKIALLAVPIFLFLWGCCAKRGGGGSRHTHYPSSRTAGTYSPRTPSDRIVDLESTPSTSRNGWETTPSSTPTQYGDLHDVQMVMQDGGTSPTSYPARVPDSTYTPRRGFSLMQGHARPDSMGVSPSGGVHRLSQVSGFSSVALVSNEPPYPVTPSGPYPLTIPASEVAIELDFDSDSDSEPPPPPRSVAPRG